MSPADLVDALRAAPAASRDLDREIALAFDGFAILGTFYGDPRYCQIAADGSINAPGQSADQLVPEYTRSLGAALALLERRLPGEPFTVRRNSRGQTFAGAGIPYGASPFRAATPALALCAAIVAEACWRADEAEKLAARP